jgi:peptidoglycan/LPS O-acetylase OafA/YrhL
VYLYHFMMVTLLVRLFGPATSWSMLAAVLFLYAVLTLGAAALSYYAVEAPVLRWRDKRYPRQ